MDLPSTRVSMDQLGDGSVQQTVRAPLVEVQHPISDDLKPGTANHRRLSTRRAIISCGERQKPTGLRTVFRFLRQTTQLSLAESLDICLIEEELAGALPVGGLGSAVGQRQHVGSHVLDRGQDATVLGRERAGQAAFEIDGRPQHGRIVRVRAGVESKTQWSNSERAAAK